MEKIKEIFIGWGNSLAGNLPSIILALVFVVLFFIFAQISKKVAYRMLNRVSKNAAINRLLGTFTALAVMLIGIIVALKILGLNTALTSLLAGAGIAGIALGFAFQDLGANLIAGITVAVQKPFNVGDLVKVDKYFGTVKSINLRITELETLQGETIYIPNKSIMANPIQDYTGLGVRRVDLKLGVSYAEDLEKTRKVILGALNKVDSLQSDRPVEVFFEKFDDYSINLLAYFWINFEKQLDYRKARSDAMMEIKKAFNENNITIPFPIRTLDFGIKGGTRWDELT